MKRIALSFDNGPDPKITPRVLDVLGDRGIRAHFFVLGKLVALDAGRVLVARARDEGHLIGNHSYTHEIPLGQDPRGPDAVRAEIEATAALLLPEEKRFRPFGGGGVIGRHLLSSSAVDYLVANEYSCVLWSSVPRDWEDQRGWPERALADCASREHSVVVLHDIANACLEKLASFLDETRARGFEFTLDLPADCVPIVRGKIVGDMHALGGAS